MAENIQLLSPAQGSLDSQQIKDIVGIGNALQLLCETHACRIEAEADVDGIPRLLVMPVALGDNRPLDHTKGVQDRQVVVVDRHSFPVFALEWSDQKGCYQIPDVVL